MKTLKNLCAFFFFSVALLITGCIGDEGPMGIQGADGIDGIDGSVFYSGNTAPLATVGKDGDMYLDKVSATLYGPKLSGSWGTGISLQGAAGATGATGATGPAGAAGAAGTPGSKILSGNGAPVLSIGAVSDYYLDKNTGLLYGPKTATSWGTPTNLKGAQGIQGLPGEDGSMFYSGNGAPSAAIGKAGDMYLDKANVLLYGPKISTGWETGLSLKGSTGTTGATGATGPQGTAGTPGSKILSGTGSPALSIGVAGDYYLDKNTGLLYGPKTVTSWGIPTNLKGAQGIQGLPGEDGSMFYSGNGAPLATIGKIGDMYLDKVNVLLYGPKTTTGWGTGLSLKGSTGATGATGPQGAAGTPGSKILSGTGSPSLTIGIVGDYYLDTATGLLYGPKTATSWGTPTNLKGAQGIQGLPGKDGSMFYSGNGAPATTIGKDGDMYLDKTNVLLYGPKTANGWGTGISLKGATGAAGTPGSKILSGSGAPALTIGIVGDYYIDLSIGMLYGPKTSTSWGTPISLKGPKGDKGDKGDTGTANVIYSDWLVVRGGPDPSGTFVGPYYIKVPDFEKNPTLLDNASIVVYAKEFQTDEKTVAGIHQLNFTSPIWQSAIIQYRIDVNDLVININSSPDTKAGLKNSHQFRYVIIPGGVPATRSAIDYSNYEAVKATFGLKD